VYRGWRAFFVRTILAGSVLTLLGAGLVSAQSIPFDFNLTITLNNNTEVVNSNNVQVGVSQPGSFTVIATYTGSTMATLSNPVVQGSIAFTAAFVNASAPVVLTPGQSVTFKVTYAPTNPNTANAQINVPYVEPISGNTITNSIIIVASATTPAFSLVYALAPNNNFVPILSGGTIQFPPTQLNTTATATLDIRNTGSGSGNITGVTLPPSTSPFQLLGVPPATPDIPFPVAAGTAQAIGIQYTPTAVEKDTAQFTITFQDGTVDTINLAGSGATSTFTYTIVSGTTTTAVKAGGTIDLGTVAVATGATTTPASSSVLIQVKNTGNANGVINSINAAPDPPFAVSGQPNVPPTLKPGDSENFSVTFTPTQVGPQPGTLLVGNDTFKLTGTGGGPQLTFSYVANGVTVPLPTGGAVVFPSIAVSKSETENFTVTNSGTADATVTLVSTSTPFSVPSFTPTTLKQNQSAKIPITFTPATVGPATGTLLVNSTSIQLVGAGTSPPNLPSYTISGPSGNVAAASQEPVSLTLAHSYPIDLNGVLTLTTSGNFGTDPAVQFEVGSSAGNRTVDFTIPAGSTSADFVGQGSQIFLQTGTVAETVLLKPSFATASGFDLTPASPTTLEFTIPSSAPVLQSIGVTNAAGSSTAASFTLVIIGYSTTRDLSSLTATLTPASGFNLKTSQFTTDLTGPANLWFQSTVSQGFGGLFQVSVPFNLTGSVKATQSLLQAIGSVSVTITNSVGTSSTLETSLAP
jgi:hypothetical protein